MTSQNPSAFSPPKIVHLESPRTLDPIDLSLVIPVKNNAAGIKRLINALAQTSDHIGAVREVIIVDDCSRNSLKLEFIKANIDTNIDIPIRIIQSGGIGPAGARNKGYTAATGEWILFIDSDCIPTGSLISGYQQSLNGSVGYAGHIKALGDDSISRYYDSQQILVPFGLDEHGMPCHVVTANTLIWRPALEAVNGFDEWFHLAAGEDVDVGLRLSQIGRLTYVPYSVVLHDYGGLYSFIERFLQYGRANAMLEKKYCASFAPQRSAPKVATIYNYLLSNLQYLTTLLGYLIERAKQ